MPLRYGDQAERLIRRASPGRRKAMIKPKDVAVIVFNGFPD